MTNSSFELRCPKCQNILTATTAQSGETVNCPRCQNPLLVPGSKPAAANVTVDDLIDFDDDILHPASTDPNNVVATAANDPGLENGETASQVPKKDTNDAAADAQKPLAEIDADSASGVNVIEDEEDDLVDLLPATPVPGASTTRASDHKDPFEVDEDANLRIAGITPADNTFSVNCQLCGSLVYATPSQVGQKLRCHDCHSLVQITAPKKKQPDPGGAAPNTFSPYDEDQGYRLSPPVELPEIDTRIDKSSGDIDYDDDDFFEKKRRQLHQTRKKTDDARTDDDEIQIAGKSAEKPHRVEPIDDKGIDFVEKAKPLDWQDSHTGSAQASADDEGFGLEPADDDLIDPISFPGFGPTAHGGKKTGPPTTPTTPPGSATPKSKTQLKQKKKRSGPKLDAPVEPVDKPHFAFDSDYEDIKSPLDDYAAWIKNSIVTMANADVLIRGVFCVLPLVVCYWLILMGVSRFSDDTNSIQKFVGFMILAVGLAPIGVVGFFLGVMANSVIRVAMERRGDVGDWPDFSFADWFSRFAYVATSFFLAALPGLFLGAIVYLSSARPEFGLSAMAFMTFISMFLLTPIFLSSVVFNESPLQLISSEVLNSFGPLKNRWIRFAVTALLLGILFSVFTAYVSVGGLFTVIVAVVQIAVLFFYFWVLGDHVGQVVRLLVSKTES